ncbi:hypothetical protein WME73_21800 [Sorangium sp. So ce302]|uniref:hypothetical protein n=1 Tax=Sorangium sp. So ce302 TaxID=3133297 RepID=UPI003F618DC6
MKPPSSRGFELVSAERGPTHCASSCYALGMRMSAFVLVDRAVAGCMCEPVQAPAGSYVAPHPAAAPPRGRRAPGSAAAPGRASAAAAAAYAVIEAYRNPEEQQSLRITQPK